MTASPALLRLAGLERFTIPGKRYPTKLPPALEANYCYTVDGGHSILVVLANEYRAGKPVADYLTPAAVRTVLRRGYTVNYPPLTQGACSGGPLRGTGLQFNGCEG